MKLSILVTSYDILNAKGNLVAYVIRAASGYWHFHDIPKGWHIECQRRLEESEILAEYKAIKTRWYAVRKAQKARKAK